MDKIARVGVDLAKNIMQIHAVDGAERVVVRKTLVAVANKHARILWAVLAKGERFDPSHAPACTGEAAGA